MSTPDRRPEEILRIFFEIGRALARGEGLEPTVRAIVRAATRLTGAAAGSLLVLDPARKSLIHRMGHRLTRPERAISFAVGEGVAGWVAASGRAANVGDARRDRRFVAKPGQRRVIRSLLCVPVRARGSVLGVLTVTASRPRAFRRAESRLLTLLAGQVAIDLESARLTALATRDPLTGIPNRRRFDEALAEAVARARREKSSLALAILDLDHFKEVNDHFGHPAGDAVLVQASRRWSGAVRGRTLLARIGGEEFGLILPGADLPAAAALARRLKSLVGRRRPFQHGPLSLKVTVSVGVAVSPDGTASGPRLFSSADRALYRAKRAGRDRVRLTRLR